MEKYVFCLFIVIVIVFCLLIVIVIVVIGYLLLLLLFFVYLLLLLLFFVYLFRLKHGQFLKHKHATKSKMSETLNNLFDMKSHEKVRLG